MLAHAQAAVFFHYKFFVSFSIIQWTMGDDFSMENVDILVFRFDIVQSSYSANAYTLLLFNELTM